MNSNSLSTKQDKLFDIAAPYNSLAGKFSKGERLTVNVVRYASRGWDKTPYWRVEVKNAGGETVNQILKTALTRKTALGWANGNFSHCRVSG